MWSWRYDLLGTVGVVNVVVGVWQMFPPLALIVAGVAMIYVAFLGAQTLDSR